MGFSGYSWKYCPDTDRSTGEYIIFYKGRPIVNGKYFPVPVAQSSV